MIIALIPSSSKTETLLNNLAEAEFQLADVSVVMADQKTQRAIAKDTGPFAGTRPADLETKLVRKGVSRAQARVFTRGIQKGQVFVAIACPLAYQKTALEMLKDYDARYVRVLP